MAATNNLVYKIYGVVGGKCRFV